MKQLARDALGRLGYRLEGIRFVPRQLRSAANLRHLELDDVICRRMFDVGPSLNFLQIGAFDGVTKDPLHKYIDRCGWRGILVEPQPAQVTALSALYRGSDRVRVLQAAVDATAGNRPLHIVDSQDAPVWARGLASFDRATIVKHRSLVPGIEAMIRDIPTDCVTFDRVLDLLACERLDVLQLDVEGMDGMLLSCFPFDRVRPAIVHWEIKHADVAAREACFDRLLRFGYRLASSGGEDMMAVLPAGA